MMNDQRQTAAARYAYLKTKRQPFLDRAIDCAKYTIPTLMPEDGHNSYSKINTPFQAVGARGVNTLAAKLLTALLPPNQPFFRMVVSDYLLEQITQREGMRAQVDEALNKYERAIMTDIETNGIRVTFSEAARQLVVAGNVLIYVPDNGITKYFKLNQYVCVRDPMGNLLEIIIEEVVSYGQLPDAVQSAISQPGKNNHEKSKKLYTRIVLEKDRWKIYQEIDKYIPPESLGEYPKDKLPYLAMRWTKLDGEDYGRSYTEDYLGDLKSLEALSQAIVEGSAAMSRGLLLVEPNGDVNPNDIIDAPNWAVVTGRADQVSALQILKGADFGVAQTTIAKIEQRLLMSYLVNGAVQRQGERVTAEEIRYVANELEEVLGGTYAIFSREFQLPLVNVIISRLERTGKAPVMPKGMTAPTITTGLEALGRGQDMSKLLQFAQIVSQSAGLPAEINKADFVTRIGTALGIDMAGLIKSPEEVQQEQQQAMMLQMMQQVAPNAANKVGDMMLKSMDQPNQQTQ